MSAGKYIKIRKPKIFNGKTVVFQLSYSKDVEKYFWSNKLYVEYEKGIEDLDLSILQIPAISGVITVAWAVGADVYVEELDETYLKSLGKIKSVIRRLHPSLPFSSKIYVGNIVSNRFVNDRYGLLFTEGVDSVTSYIRNKHKKPDLINVWGIDVRPDDRKTWKKIRKMLTDFASKEAAKLHIIRTNIPRVVNRQVLHKEFGLEWWLQISHSIVLTGLCAPLTCVVGIGTLLIASDGITSKGRSKYLRSTGSHPLVDNNISWGDIKVVHDNYEMSRQLKIRCFLRNYVENHGYLFLKACNNTQHPESNCCKCEKCLRTITGLALEGIDPNKCGFDNLSSKTFDYIKESFVKKKFFRKKWIVESEGEFWARIGAACFWEDIQRHLPQTLEDDLYGSKEFLEWFRHFNVSEYLQQIHKNVKISLPYYPYICALTICYYLPLSAQRVFNQLLNFWIGFFIEHVR